MKERSTNRTPRWALMAALAALLLTVWPLAQLATASPPSDGLPPEKQRIEDQYERERNAGLLRRAPKGPAARLVTVGDDQGRLTGVIERGPAPFSAQDVTVRNQWQRQVDGVWTQVYAGALAGRPEQGVVIVLAEGAAGQEPATQRYLPPQPAGALRIVEESGGRFTLEAGSGARLSFDLGRRSFEAP